ncbi:MAG: hypothetical protein JO359_04020 [Candidatus Eremiobacteraeota bacterium]|nr:hypothetical protein [Candidatus Eremiobacteraeota bacterium]
MRGEAQIGKVTNAGQPTDEELAALKAQGYSTVINIRLPEEQDEPEGPKVEAAGMRYVSIPYNIGTLTPEHIRQVREAIESAPPGKVLTH